MKLKRFENDEINESRDYTVSKPQVEIDNPDGWKEMDGMFMQPKNEDVQKFEIIERLSKHWNEKLKNEYLVPRSLYNYSLNELKEIEKFYIGEPVIEPVIEESSDITDKKCTICETLAELKELHMNNEAVEDIYAEDGVIVFDCKCETDIQGTSEYNGFPLRFNKLCEVKYVNENVSFEEEMTEEQIIEHARMIKESCINEYLNEIRIIENKLSDDISNILEENLTIDDFAIGVANVIKEHYGSHNVRPFLNKLEDELLK